MAIESRFGYDCEDRQPCKCETSQKSPDVSFDSALIIFVTLFICRSQKTTITCTTVICPSCANPEWGGGGRGPDPLRNHKNIGFLSAMVQIP